MKLFIKEMEVLKMILAKASSMKHQILLLKSYKSWMLI